MAKNLKLNIKNEQIAEAVNLSGLKGKLAKKREEAVSSPHTPLSPAPLAAEERVEQREEPLNKEEHPKEEAPRIRARTKSAFEPTGGEGVANREHAEGVEATKKSPPAEGIKAWAQEEAVTNRAKTSAELRRDIFGDVTAEATGNTLKKPPLEPLPVPSSPSPSHIPPRSVPTTPRERVPLETGDRSRPGFSTATPRRFPSDSGAPRMTGRPPMRERENRPLGPPPTDRLGPTGRHIKDYYRPRPPSTTAPSARPPRASLPTEGRAPLKSEGIERDRSKFKPKTASDKEGSPEREESAAKGPKATKFKEFREVKPTRRADAAKQFDARDRQGLRASEDEQQWRKKKNKGNRLIAQEDQTIRPTALKIRVPISIKDLAAEMKLKASQLISKLFLQGIVVTLNDLLEDETTLQLLGHEFGCDIALDTTEQRRIQITDKSIREELMQTAPERLQLRPPVVAFMGHVDHGKTSLIDAIRASNRAAGEAGAITQHIGAFLCKTPVGDITILDTPGHEAFSAMRARGADVTDIVVLVVAGDEGLKQQTIEAIEHARAAHVITVVAINKCDKPNFNVDQVYRQLADQNLLPEAWGGQTLTVNCSAMTGEGIPQLLEMLALQAEVLELRADAQTRARGTVLESEMHKGMGAVATILVQNGTLRKGDAIVFGQLWGRIKTMHDENRREVKEAGPSTPVQITGLSGLPEAGQEFVVVKNEKEARDIAEARSEGMRQTTLLLQQKKKGSMENLLQQTSATTGKKILNVVLRADVQGSLEALKTALLKIESEKVELNLVFAGVGEVSESDVQLAATSKAIILGFHTQIESHAELLLKQLNVQVRLHNIIYHAVDDIKALMAGLLERIPQETEKGKALVKATFKSSHAGVIAGCQVIEGSIHRNHHIRVRRGQQVVWKGTIASLKRVKEDVREVQKGLECGILLNHFSEIQENDVLEAYEITYIEQQL